MCLALAVVTLWVYWPVRQCEFLNWDDLTYVSANDHVRGGLTWGGLVWAFTHSYSSNWHPLTWLSHALDCQLYGLAPAGHHLTNALLHAVNSALLLLLLRSLTGAFWRSALVAALFALHPLRVESVAWVAERKDVLSGFFFLLTLWAYSRYAQARRLEAAGCRLGEECRKRPRMEHGSNTDEPRPRSNAGDSSPASSLQPAAFYLLSLACFALGLMSKPMLVTLPFVLLLLDYWPLRRLQPNTQHSTLNTVLPLLREKLPFFALAAASCVVTFLAQRHGGAVASLTTLSLGTRLANVPVAYVQYLAKLFWPANLSPLYPHPSHWEAGLVAGAAAVLLVVTAGVWWARRRFPYALTGWLWYLGMLVPVIGIVQVGSQAFADRYTYLPLVGITIALVWLAAAAIASRPGPLARARVLLTGVAALALAAAFAGQTRAQLAAWKDTGTLFRHALALGPSNVQALYGLGVHYAETGRLEEGQRLLEQAIRLQPAFPEALGGIANLLDGQGKYQDAIRFHREGLKVEPDHPGILNNLAWLLASCPDPAYRDGPEAVRLATRACELTEYRKPLFIGTLAAAQAEAGNFTGAVATAERAAALAGSLGLEDIAARNRELMELYRAGKPFHEPGR